MGFTGMAVVFLGGKGVTADIRPGDFIILANTFLWACNTVYIKRIIHNFDPFQIVLYSMIFSIPFFFLEGYLWDKPMVSYVDREVLFSLMYQGFLTASFGFVAWNYLLRKYGAVSLHSFIFLMPIGRSFSWRDSSWRAYHLQYSAGIAADRLGHTGGKQ